MKETKKFLVTIIGILLIVLGLSSMALYLNVKAEDTFGKITLNKTAVPSGNRTAKITLDINTTNLEQTTTDIIIVMDRSGSMSKTVCVANCDSRDPRDREYEYRLTVAKNQAKELIKKVLPVDNNGNIRVGVVSFGTNYEKRYSTQTYENMTSNQSTALNMINNIQITNDNGTNLQAGLNAAKNLLSSSNANNKIIVLISDGEPTYFNVGNNLCGDGQDDGRDYSLGCNGLKPSEAAIEEAAELKDVDGQYKATIYAVGYGDSQGNLAAVLTQIATPSTNEFSYEFNAIDTKQLQEAMEAIATNIKHILATDATVTDIIPNTFKLTDDAIAQLKENYGNNITISTNSDGETTIEVNYKEISSIHGKYTITYEVEAKDEYSGAMYTNKEATFTATATEDNIYYQNKSISLVFDKPVVPIAPVTKDDDLTSTNYLEGNTYTIDKDTILNNDNDALNPKIEKIVIQDRLGLTIPNSIVTNNIVIDKVSCGTATVNNNGDILYTATEGCEGNPTIDYHIVSNITIYQYDGTNINKEDTTVTSIAYKGTNNYVASSTITLSVERVPVTYQVKYLEQGTNKELVPSKTVDGYKNRDVVTETALTGYESSNVSILKEYDLVGEKTQTITLGKTNNVITFYYKKKTIKTEEPELTKESSTSKITSLKDPIKYTISYYTEVNDFKGELTVTLIDTLPHKIVENESTYKCSNTSTYSCTSTYNEEKETITYVIKYNINTFETGKKFIIDYSMDIKLKYDEKDFDGSETSITNRVSTHLTADETKIDNYDDKEIPTNIEGTVKAVYVYEDTTGEEQKIADGRYDTTHTAKIGTPYETSKKDISGYTFKEVRGKEKGTITEGTITITYVYTKDPPSVTEDPTVIKKASEGSVITSTNQEVTYSIDYKTKVKNHDGDVTLKVVDTLEYEISSVTSHSTGWIATYDGNKTITFTKKYHIHTSVVESNEIEIEELLSYTVKYKTFEADKDTDNYLTNKAKPSITIEQTTTTGEETKEDIPIDVKGNVKINYLEINTNRILHTATYQFNPDVKVGTNYETQSITIGGYELVSNSGNTTGTVKETLTEVTYYYKRKSADPQNPILTKTGTTSITAVDEKVKYRLTYEAEISGYEGDVTITMVDKLPYKIDLAKSTIGGNYVYNENDKTITWTVFKESDIKPEDTIPISFIEDLELVYIGIPSEGEKFKNEVEIHIIDDTNNDHVEKEEHETTIDIKGHVIVRHIDDTTGKELDEVSPENISGKVGTTYTTSPANISGYVLVREKIPHNASGTYIDGTINVIYRYKKIDIILTDETATKLSSTEKIVSLDQNVDYEINYNALVDYRGTIIVTIVDKLEYPIDKSKSILSGGTYNENDLTITWTEKIENLNTYLIGAKHHVSIQKIISLRYKGIPSNGTVKNTITAYIETEEGKTDEVTPGIVIIPTEIKGNLIVEYIYVAEDGTLKELDSYSKEDYVGNSYTTEAKNFNTYTLTTTPDNATGNIVEGTTRVTYFYSKTPSEIKDNKVDKSSKKDKITNINDAFDYTIKYNTEIAEYIGEATVTIVDELTHPIDTTKSNLNGGVYDKENLTITWTKKYNVNTYENKNNKININIQISLYYKNLNPEDRVVVNNVKTKLEMDNIKEPVITTDKEETKLEVSGKVIAKYVDEEGTEIANKVITTDLVGRTYETKAKEIDNYVLSKTNGKVTGKYIDGEIVVTYVYEKEGTGTVEPPKGDEEPILPPNTNATINLTILSTILLSIIGLTISIKKVIKL